MHDFLLVIFTQLPTAFELVRSTCGLRRLQTGPLHCRLRPVTANTGELDGTMALTTAKNESTGESTKEGNGGLLS